MRQKRIFTVILLLTAILISFSSCTQPREVYEAEYPEYLTPEYCYENYTEADPNLIYLFAAQNSIGKYRENISSHTYYAVKDLPIEKYICSSEVAFMVRGYQYHVLKHKNNTEEAITDYEAQKVELVWMESMPFEEEKSIPFIGSDIVYETVASFDAKAFQDYLTEAIFSIRNGDAGEDVYSMPIIDIQYRDENYKLGLLNLKIRMHFSEYENLVWDASLIHDENDYYDGKYYMWIYLFTVTDIAPEGYYDQFFIPVSEEFEPIIDEAINNKEQ